MKGYEILQAYERKFNEPVAYPFGLDEQAMKQFEDVLLDCINKGERYDVDKYKKQFYPDNVNI